MSAQRVGAKIAVYDHPVKKENCPLILVVYWSIILHIGTNLLVGISLCASWHGQQSFDSILFWVVAVGLRFE